MLRRCRAVAAGLLIALPACAQKPERLTFDVASIKLANPDQQGGGIKAMPGGQKYVAMNVPIRLIFSPMYKVPLRQISGGPGWLDTERYDIEAIAAHPYDLDDLHTTFQSLLADEFKLQFHKEIKDGPAYVLTVDKTGSKMKLNQSDQDFKIPINASGAGAFIGTRVPMSYFSWWLSQVVLVRQERPVIDKTGLDGFYDFTLTFAPELPPGANTENLPPELLERPTIFSALKDQLGLKLEAQKGPWRSTSSTTRRNRRRTKGKPTFFKFR